MVYLESSKSESKLNNENSNTADILHKEINLSGPFKLPYIAPSKRTLIDKYGARFFIAFSNLALLILN